MTHLAPLVHSPLGPKYYNDAVCYHTLNDPASLMEEFDNMYKDPVQDAHVLRLAGERADGTKEGFVEFCFTPSTHHHPMLVTDAFFEFRTVRAGQDVPIRCLLSRTSMGSDSMIWASLEAAADLAMCLEDDVEPLVYRPVGWNLQHSQHLKLPHGRCVSVPGWYDYMWSDPPPNTFRAPFAIEYLNNGVPLLSASSVLQVWLRVPQAYMATIQSVDLMLIGFSCDVLERPCESTVMASMLMETVTVHTDPMGVARVPSARLPTACVHIKGSTGEGSVVSLPALGVSLDRNRTLTGTEDFTVFHALPAQFPMTAQTLSRKLRTAVPGLDTVSEDGDWVIATNVAGTRSLDAPRTCPAQPAQSRWYPRRGT
jgi:hypothetical protein